MKRSGTVGKFSPTEVAQVGYVEFVAFSQEQIESWSVAELNQSTLYEGSKPMKGSPNDLRLGVSSQDQKCQTCGQTKQCQGHFGHIKLAEAVFHFGYIKYIEKILRCVCHKCCRIKRPANELQFKKFQAISRIQNPQKKLNEMAKLLHNIKECSLKPNENGETLGKTKGGGCGSIIPIKVTLRNYRIYVEEAPDSKRTKVYERGEVKKILQELSKNKEDCRLLGFSVTKPIDLMIRTLAVPPPQIRPSIQMNPQRRAEDDITTAYVKIIASNQNIKEDSAQHADKAIKVDELERMIASIMIKLDRIKLQKSAVSSMGKKKAIKNIKSISDRLKGKQGRFRQNLMGKRVDFSARSVVSPDSNLALDQLGVPEKIAYRLTVPQEITKWNYDRILALCKAGKVHVLLKPPEDRLRDDDKPIRVEKIEHSQIQKYLNYGMIAERCLQDGDYVLFNRQPTLHRMSMMGHRVKILPYNTFRLNLSVCTPYNADFDGDEMNMHVPQSFETISELKNIAHVPKQIIAPKNNAPVMGIVQDALLGVYLFTMRDTFLTREQIMNLVIWIEDREGGNLEDFLPGQLPIPAILKPEPLWTGKQVMSLIIPKKITLNFSKGKERDDTLSNVNDVSMKILKGELLTGALQKEMVGSGPGGLVHSIWLEIGPAATCQFITVAQRIVNNWLISNSFSVGAADIVPDAQLYAKIRENRKQVSSLYYKIFNQYRSAETISEKNLHQKGKKILDSYEYNINANLNNRLGKAQEIIREKVSPYLNNIFKMITAKSKGSDTNLVQIMFLVGNQNVDGKRCPLGFARRALPHFNKDDNSPEPRGFVFSSFYEGLKPHEFFFHAMGGREGLSDTAVKTSRTGYIQRKLVKSLEDVVVKYDGTVRDSKNNFLQKCYGEDGFVAEYIEKQKFEGVELSDKDFQKKYKWQDNELYSKFGYNPQETAKLDEEYQRLKEARKRIRDLFMNGRDQTTFEYYCPIKIDRLINKIQTKNFVYDREAVQPFYVYDRIEKLIDKCVPPQSLRKYNRILDEIKMKGTGNKKVIERYKQFERESGIQMFRIHLRHHLASKFLCEKLRLSKAAFNGLIDEIQTKYFQALVPPGESIGAIAAQSIGQPTTQMTLNTFHLAGVSDKNVTLGVPRLQELLDASKNIKTPNMTIHLKDRILYKNRADPEFQTRILEISEYHLPERQIKYYIEASRFFYDFDPYNSRAGFRILESHQDIRRTPWVIKIQFSCKKINIKKLWEEISDKIYQDFKKIFQITQQVQFNQAEDINPELVLRLCDNNEMVNQKSEEKEALKFLMRKENEIKGTSIGGIEGIKSVKTSKRLMLNVSESSSMNLTDAEKKEHEYIVFETDGSNLSKCLQHPLLDSRKTTCNDMSEIYNILGIEAARQSFINQFKEIIKPYGIYVNFHHLSVLTDWMSMRGFITPINRNGINRVKDVSVLRKASYEETADIMFGAAAFSERDHLKGISEKIIFGQPTEVGTSNFKIMVDNERVGSYITKAEIDKKEVMLEKSVDYQNPLNSFVGDRTPIVPATPQIFGEGGRSILSPHHYGMSPGFATPGRNLEFTPSYETRDYMGGNTSRSPLNTPIYTQQTPSYVNNMSGYGSPIGGSSYYNRNQASNIHSSHSPHYYASSSPNYSSIRHSSQSPEYNSSPLNSPYSSSPGYASTPNDSVRGNYKQEEDNDEDENDDF